MPPAARILAEWAARLRAEDIPASVRENAALRVLDTLGCALAGAREDHVPAVLALIARSGEAGPCTVVGSSLTTGPAQAALANGAMAHGLDFDDTHADSVCHGSAVLVPAVLALAESEHLSGQAALTALVAGYEAMLRIGMAAPGRFHERGWHATAVCGPFGAAVTAGKCLGLDEDGLTAALGIAASMASGVMEFLEDGSWVKRLHPGWAGQAGATAAALARAGFPGPATILEGRYGLYRTFVSTDPDPLPFDTLGRTWETLNVGFKPYPACHYLHAFLDCALSLRENHHIDPDAIEAIECLVPPSGMPIVAEPYPAKLRPRTPYDAQFSLPYSVAAAFVDGRVDLDTYAADRLGEGRVLALADRVTCRPDPDTTFPNGFPGWVRVRLTDGRVVEAREPDGRGGPARPLPAGAIVEKFRANAGRVLPASRVSELERATLSLDTLADVRSLMPLCRG